TWNFGDGSYAYQQNPTHQYSDDGTYNVTLTVTDNDGATNSTTKQIVVLNVPPVANFSYLPLNPTDLDIISFTDLSNDSDGFITNWTWNFGDGSYAYQQNPTHQYSDDGTYNVTLTVTDNDGATNSTTKQIVVLNVPPVANFSYLPLNPTDLDIISFTDLSNDSDGFITNWTWNFGDGSISYQQNATHRYSDNGIYNVTLTVTDNDGAKSSLSISINISNILIANFTYTPLNPVSNQQIHFIDLSYGASGWLWDFGDGSTISQKNPYHAYPLGNYYNVTLFIYNGSLNSSVSKIVKVDNKINLFKNANNVVNYVSWLSNSTTASALANLIGSNIMPTGSVISKWNVNTGTFDSYVVGISPPSYDFVINPYDVIVLRVASSGNFIESAILLQDRMVQLFKNANNVVNHISWSCLSSTTASALANLIGSNIMPTGSVISKWNVNTGTFDSYVVGISPPSYDFVINPGDCVVLRVANGGSFLIEVIK
ncbi:MAG TPA: PKD domain-containing protein, partial [Thermoplasmatales archaeon]|nr:PKD domain-containing protein [Thermoplasmatales archaeon]